MNECDVRRLKILDEECYYTISSDPSWHVTANRVRGPAVTGFICSKMMHSNTRKTAQSFEASYILLFCSSSTAIHFTFIKMAIAVVAGNPSQRQHLAWANGNLILSPHGVNHTLSLNGIPVAKRATKRGDSGHYHVAYTDAIKHRPDILPLFAVFVEHYLERDSKV